jgi:pimeloyl-ACP methyl ester carboxylesterase
VAVLRANRLRPLSPAEREEFVELARSTGDPGAQTEAGLSRLAELADRSDTYEALAAETPSPVAGVSERAAEIYAGVWPAAARLRSQGKWLPLLEQIACPVVAIHGANEATPIESVAAPLSLAVSDFRMVVLERCGHTPWHERWAAEPFYVALEQELR